MIKNTAYFTERAFRYFSTEVRGLHAAVYILAISAILSSLLALVRDRLLAHTFGASTTLDIYFAAFRIPDLIFIATAALVSVYMLIPELSRRSENEQRTYIDTIVFGFSLFAVSVSAGAMVLAPVILEMLFPKFAVQGLIEETTTLTRIMLLQPVLLGLSNILAAITQSRRRYVLYALSPLLYNIGIIIGVTVLYPVFGTIGLAWGVVLGAFLHAGIQVPSALADGFFVRFPLLREPRALLRTVSLSLPRALALSLNQLALLGLIALAGIFPAGSIAVFTFAFNLNSVPLAIIGSSYSVATFPTLAAAFSRGEQSQFVLHVVTAARYVFFWSLPVMALIFILRAHIVRVILGSGAFDWTDTRLTAAAFALFSLSLVAQGLLLLLVRAYYAAGRTLAPLVVSAGIAALMLILGWAGINLIAAAEFREQMELLLRVRELPGTGVLMLAAAYSISILIGTAVLIMHFEHQFGGLIAPTMRAVRDSMLAALGSGLGAYVFLDAASSFQVPSTALSIFAQGFAAGTFGILVAISIYHLLGSREFREVYVSLHARLWRRPPDEIKVVSSAEQ